MYQKLIGSFILPSEQLQNNNDASDEYVRRDTLIISGLDVIDLTENED